jgi:hypothetical protein
MHKVSTRQCACITRSLCWIGIELCDPPKYDGLNNLSSFVKDFEFQIPVQQRLLALDFVLKATPTRWCATHNEGIEDWKHCRRLMQVRFGTEVEYTGHKYTRVGDPKDHIAECITIWSSISKKEMTHKFIHTLDMIPKNWYLELEMHRETTNWDELIQRFKITFTLEHEYPLLGVSLQAIRTKIFLEEGPM